MLQGDQNLKIFPYLPKNGRAMAAKAGMKYVLAEYFSVFLGSMLQKEMKYRICPYF